MSLQFYFGGSGSGKSKKLHEYIITAAINDPHCNFLLIVPDQFTMQTQMDLVLEHPNKGIMNIDVLSFGRLTHRVLEEVGGSDSPILDDTGKSLILRKIARSEQSGLNVIGSHLNKIGYIHEVKSAISEFMQYGIGVKELSQIAECAKTQGALYYKLKDLELLYGSFLSYIQEKYITTEETLDSLRQALPKSELIKNCVIAFDGFTGFTPIQYRVIQELIRLTKQVIVTITIDTGENPYLMDGEQKLFHLSKKTVADLKKLANEAGSGLMPEVICRGKEGGRLPRFGSAELAHLEQSLFRYPVREYSGKTEHIHMFEASTPKEEVRQTCIEICRLLKDGDGKANGLHYRDIAVVTGNMETYENYIEEEFAKFGIPVYMDKTRGILYNPFTEYIRSALQIVLGDFNRESVFHYLRTGMCGFDRSGIDRLENYARRFGINGRKRWSEAFVYKEGDKEEDLQMLAAYNSIREGLLCELSPLLNSCGTAGECVRALYDFLVQNEVQLKLKSFEKDFEASLDLVRANEYAQIYALVIDLLDQIDALLHDEEMSLKEFADILDAGFAEISVGTIPQNVDRIVVGDIERTRLKQVKVLFFLGINDGNIPKDSSKGGIISDIDREFIKASGFELAPTPRQQIYIQRFYLYLNMTKPSDELYLSYAKVGNDGKSLRPAYLIETVRKLFAQLEIDCPENREFVRQLANARDGIGALAGLLRDYAAGRLDKAEERNLFTFYHGYYQNSEYKDLTKRLADTAFEEYHDIPLAGDISRLLYGSILQGSVSRLERYAACAYAHFLQYGLSLKERNEYTFENVDMGNVFHGVLELFAIKLEESGHTWFDISKEESGRLLDEAVEEYAVNYGETILYSNARNQYLLKRIKRILRQTINTLQVQLKKGSFLPKHFEMSFSMADRLESVNIALSENEKMKLRGRIDRIDTCVEDDTVYVKVIDYKSGKRRFDLAALYYGLQLQLVVYMNSAVEMAHNEYPDKKIVPAAMLYYHIADPMIEDGQKLTPEELNKKLLQELKMTGMVNSDDKVVSLLDKDFVDKSDILPLERKKDGSFSTYSSVINGDEMTTVSDYVNLKIKELGNEIVNGTVSVNPCENDGERTCAYCSYKSICGFDSEIYGYKARKFDKLSGKEALERMKTELDEERNKEHNKERWELRLLRNNRK